VRVWIDLANSPHVAVFEPVVTRLRAEGAEVLLTARDHAQTVELARRSFGEVEVVGGESAAGRTRKGIGIVRRAGALRAFARARGPGAALSHGSYAQLLAARAAGVPSVTMMDYEHQPANHVSFRLARRVIVPQLFPSRALRLFGVRDGKAVRYEGFKEELYLGRFRPDTAVLDELRLDPARVIAVLRPAPEGALYHRAGNDRFDELLDRAARDGDVQAVVLPRLREQAARYRSLPGAVVPERAIDGRSLLALADLTIGAGGTMNRESALLGTPTYTVFRGALAAVDAELIRLGLLHDLRDPSVEPAFRKRTGGGAAATPARGDAILELVIRTLRETAGAPPPPES
jgi:predicted glycosyltransferase